MVIPHDFLIHQPNLFLPHSPMYTIYGYALDPRQLLVFKDWHTIIPFLVWFLLSQITRSIKLFTARLGRTIKWGHVELHRTSGLHVAEAVAGR